MATEPLGSEQARRNRGTEDILALFQAKPLRWIHWKRFASIAPCAWRTRISEARKKAQREGGSIEWNRSVRRSAYRYLPYVPLARDAGEFRTQRGLF